MESPVPQPVIVAMARREQRLHHFLWHEVRNNWLSYPKDVQQAIRDLGWEPPRPARDENGAPLLTNNSGEDFLYMHRQMIKHVNAILGDIGDLGYPRVEGWVTLPPPGDPDFPVSPAWFDPGAPPVINEFV